MNVNFPKSGQRFFASEPRDLSLPFETVMSYFYIALTIFFTVYGQLILKWQVSQAGALPDGTWTKLVFLLQLFLNPWVVSAFFSAFLASLAWMAVMTKLDLSHAYPFMSLNFVVVLVLSVLLFQEPVNVAKLVGLTLIIAGLTISSQG